jgi:hypothetical protein
VAATALVSLSMMACIGMSLFQRWLPGTLVAAQGAIKTGGA